MLRAGATGYVGPVIKQDGIGFVTRLIQMYGHLNSALEIGKRATVHYREREKSAVKRSGVV